MAVHIAMQHDLAWVLSVFPLDDCWLQCPLSIIWLWWSEGMPAIALPDGMAKGEKNIAKAIRIAKTGLRLTRTQWAPNECFSTRLFMAAFFKIVKDRAVRPIVPMTTGSEMFEGLAHPVQHRDLFAQFSCARQSE